MCGSKGGGSPPVPSAASTTFNSTVRPNPSVEPLYTDFLNRANALSNTPFNPAMMGTVAPLNAQQTQAGNQLFNLGMDMGNFDPAKVQSIMSPFTQSVVGKTQDWFNNQNAIQSNDLLSQAIRSGNAFGGDRAGTAQGILAGQQQLAQAPVIAGLYERGYGQALDEYNRLKQYGIQGAGAALGWGGVEQQQQQREYDVAQQNAMMQSAYPFQTLNWYGSLLGGVAPLLGQQAFGANNPPEQSGLGAALGAGAAAVGLGTAALGGGGGPQGQRDGGIIQRRAQGGLVPVHFFEYGGSAPYGNSDDDQRDRDRDTTDYHYDDSRPATPQEPDFGLSKGWTKPTSPGPQFPGFPGGTGGQQKQKSDLESGLDLATKAIPLVTKLAPLMLLKRGGWVIPHLADGGLGDDVMSDESEYPVEPGQQYARDYAGRTTWFNPRNEAGGYSYRDDTGQVWTDYGAAANREGRHASGLPSTTAGFASPGSSDLGNYFRVSGPGGVTTIARKTDIGPAGVIDLNAPLAARMYGQPGAVPSGRTSVVDLGRNPPAGADAGSTQWPDPSKGNQGQLPSPDQPDTPAWQVPGARQGRAEPTVEAGPVGPRAGTGPVGGQMPGRPAPTFAQRASQNPLLQFGLALMANPGIKGREGSAIGRAGLFALQQQNEQRKQDLLDAKPKLIDIGGQMHWQTADNQLIPTGMQTQSAKEFDWQRKTQRPFAVEEEKPGRFGTTDIIKRSYRYDENGNLVEVTPQEQGAPAGQQQRVITPDQQQAPALPPPSPPRQQRQSEQSAPSQVAQTEETPAEPLPAPPAASAAAAEPSQLPTPPVPSVTSSIPVGTRTGGAQLPQVAAAQQPAVAGPAAQGLETGEAAWKTHIMPAGRPTDPQALEAQRNPAAIAHLDPEDQATIKAVADYTVDPKKLFPGQKGAKLYQAVDSLARAYDPTYNPANLNARAKALVEYGVNGKAQQNLQSNAMVLEHFGDVMTAIDKLGNSTVPLYNKITGTYQMQTGDPKYQAALSNLRTAAEAASAEAAKTFRGVGSMSQRESQLWSQIMLGSEGDIITASPVSMRAAVQELTSLVAGRLNATAEGYNQIMGPAYYRSAESWMTPKARETFQRAGSIRPEDNKPFPPSRFGVTKGGPSGSGDQGGGGGGQQQGGGGGWMQDPASGNWKGPDGRIYDRNGKPLQ